MMSCINVDVFVLIFFNNQKDQSMIETRRLKNVVTFVRSRKIINNFYVFQIFDRHICNVVNKNISV